jgi:hypothetical protein
VFPRRQPRTDEMRPDVLLTLREAAAEMDPPMTEKQLAGLVHVVGLRPRGFRRTRSAGRPARTYPAGALYRLHASVAPLLAEFREAP